MLFRDFFNREGIVELFNLRRARARANDSAMKESPPRPSNHDFAYVTKDGLKITTPEKSVLVWWLKGPSVQMTIWLVDFRFVLMISFTKRLSSAPYRVNLIMDLSTLHISFGGLEDILGSFNQFSLVKAPMAV